MAIIGESVTRLDAKSKVTGEAKYPGDFNYPNQVYMKVLFADRPHAIVKGIDVSQAESMPGVIAVLTARDVPVNAYGLGTADQPVLCGPGSDQPYADRVRFIGDQIACIIADTEEIASEARKTIVVEYEDLPIITDPYEAMKPEAILLNPAMESNVFSHYRIRKGDVDKGFDDADVIIEGEYHTPAQEHAYLQPEAGVSYIDDEGRVTVVVAGQWTHEDREQIAHSLALPEDRIRVIYPAIGGAFGGREDMSVQIILGLASMRLHERGIDRPVKIIWSREESIVGHGKRHPYHIRTKWGASKDGKILAAEVELVADGGAYVYTSPKVMGNATLQCTGPYEIPNVSVDSYAVYTNNLPGAAFRGFGGPQGAFVSESQMNKLAAALDMDPVEIRMRNLLKEGSLTSVQTPLPHGVSLTDVAKTCAEAAGWVQGKNGWSRENGFSSRDTNEPSKKRGWGFSCSLKNIGFSFGAPEGCWATIELIGTTEIEKAILHHAGAEVGQGSHTVFVQMAAEALGIPIDKVELVASDTATSDNSGSVSASRMTFMAGSAIKGAAEAALEIWKAEERPAVATYRYNAPPTTGFDKETGKCDPNISYGYVAEAIETEVDIDTGQIRLLKIICVDDVGKAINPANVKGQIEGCLVQAAGYTILENFVQKDGQVLTPTLSTYLIPTVLDIPEEIDSIIVEHTDPRGPWGARGMGEMPYISVAPTITSAVYHATGVWFDEFPLTPERVLAGLGRLD